MATVTKVVVVDGATGSPSAASMRFALYTEDGSPRVLPKQVDGQSDSAAEDLSTLVEEFNALLAKLRESGVLSETEDAETETEDEDEEDVVDSDETPATPTETETPEAPTPTETATPSTAKKTAPAKKTTAAKKN